MFFKIETNVPIPPRKRATTAQGYDYPFKDMKPNDSFVVQGNDEMARCRNQASRYTSETGVRFKTRTIDAASETYRIWRVVDLTDVTQR
jgi:hypothetical protein